MKRIRTYILLWCLAASAALWAVPATPDSISYTLSDGQQVSVLLHGDEHFHYYTLPDGQWVRLDKERGVLPRKALTEQQVAHERQQRVARHRQAAPPRRFPLRGKQKSVVLLVRFQDNSFTILNTQRTFSRMLNEHNYKTDHWVGSARDYFRSASNGLFDPEFVVYGPYVLPHEMAYYGADEETGGPQMVRDACEVANADVNFAEYDTDGDGYIDNVFVYYAGYNEAEGADSTTMWPHRYAVQEERVTGTVLFDGVKVYDYACTSELRSNKGKLMCGIGTFVHEFGHVLGLPDYYHTFDSRNHPTLRQWSVMDQGSYLNYGFTPPMYSAYDRFFLGWQSPVEIDRPSNPELRPLSQDTVLPSYAQSYLLSATEHNMDGANPNPKEFFVLEYRRQAGWDTYLPDEGLLLWHIDYSESAWSNNTPNNYSGELQTAKDHMRVYLQPPDGTMSCTGWPFHTGESFVPKLWKGTDIDRSIDYITLTDSVATFLFMGGADVNLTPPVVYEPSLWAYNSLQISWTKKEVPHYKVDYRLTCYTVSSKGDTTFVANKVALNDTVALLNDLQANTEYAYYVQARMYDSEAEYWTYKSNVVRATTLEEAYMHRLPVSVLTEGEQVVAYVVSKPAADDVLYLYDEVGRLLWDYHSADNLVRIEASQLRRGHTYLLKSGKKYGKIVY